MGSDRQDPATQLQEAVSAAVANTPLQGPVFAMGTVDSTNSIAMDAGLKGNPCAIWIADAQTAGRGRGGHSWHSAPGDGLYMTALIRPAAPMGETRWLPMRTGLAVREAIAQTAGLNLDLRWPNDLFLNERKCGGILVESGSSNMARSEADQASRFFAIGIGLNVRHTCFPDELARKATSLYLETNKEFSRDELAAAILHQLGRELAEMEQHQGNENTGPDVVRRFSSASTWVSGKRVRVGADEDGTGGYTGLTCGLDADGFLRVQNDEGQMQIVVSGNVRAARE